MRHSIGKLLENKKPNKNECMLGFIFPQIRELPNRTLLTANRSKWSHFDERYKRDATSPNENLFCSS